MLPDHIWLDQTQSIGSDIFDSGWNALIRDLLGELDTVLAGSGATLELRQLKEKFGTLRFYYRLRGASPEQKAAVAEHYRAAEQRSAETCIECGAPGRIRSQTGWIAPLCDRHA